MLPLHPSGCRICRDDDAFWVRYAGYLLLTSLFRSCKQINEATFKLKKKNNLVLSGHIIDLNNQNNIIAFVPEDKEMLFVGVVLDLEKRRTKCICVCVCSCMTSEAAVPPVG